MFAGYAIIATLVFNPSYGNNTTIDSLSTKTYELNNINISGNETYYLGLTNVEFSKNQLNLTIYTNDNKFKTYNIESSYEINTNYNEMILSESQSGTASQYQKYLYIKNTTSTSVNIDFNRIYLLKKAPNTESISDQITDAVTGGLGLIDDISQNFLDGFTALFWDADSGELTPFGNFALIFLGISVTFAVIKLCLALIRQKTGS